MNIDKSRKSLWMTLDFLLKKRRVITRKKFRQLLAKAGNSWSQIESIAGVLQNPKILIVCKSNVEVPASQLVYEKGGCSSYLKLHEKSVYRGDWKMLRRKRSNFPLCQALIFADRHKRGQKITLTRHEKRRFRDVMVDGSDMTLVQFCQELNYINRPSQVAA